jgi:hypothetical protein
VLPPGGSSTVHICTQTVHRTTQLIWEECGPCPAFASCTLAFALQLRKKHGKTSVRVVEEYQLARWKQNIQNRTYVNNKVKYIPLLHSHFPYYNSRNKTETIPATIDGSQNGDRNETPKTQHKKCSRAIYRAVIAPVITTKRRLLLCSGQECAVQLRADQAAPAVLAAGNWLRVNVTT